MPTQVIYLKRPGWTTFKHQDLEVFVRGLPETIKPLLHQVISNPTRKDQVVQSLEEIKAHFAVIIRGSNFCLACTDLCRSTPVFFSGAAVSNDANALRLEKQIHEPERRGHRDAAMAGFVTGPGTLYTHLSQLEAGTCALWTSEKESPELWRHSIYEPHCIQNTNHRSLSDNFLAVMDNTIKRGIEEAAGRPIWVALSGGLDSRLLLAKLVEHRCPNLSAFTYGPRGSDEARIAQEVADRLNVPWSTHFTTPQQMKAFFLTPQLKDYWAFSDGLCSVPNFQDFLSLKILQEHDKIPNGTFIMNGQTGDYISGGHIPETLMTPSVSPETLFSAIIGKHFSLWQSLKTPETLCEIRAELATRFNITFSKNVDREEAIAIYERFEYEERQAKYVINGQRNYEFLGLNWLLPFWESDIVNFWRDVPIEAKFRQKLYRNTVDYWNYRGIFREIKTTVSHWPGLRKLVLGPSRLLRVAFGRPVRDAYLKRMLYFGLYHDQYAPFGYSTFLRHAADLRNPVSLLSRAWLDNFKIPSLQK